MNELKMKVTPEQYEKIQEIVVANGGRVIRRKMGEAGVIYLYLRLDKAAPTLTMGFTEKYFIERKRTCPEIAAEYFIEQSGITGGDYLIMVQYYSKERTNELMYWNTNIWRYWSGENGVAGHLVEDKAKAMSYGADVVQLFIRDVVPPEGATQILIRPYPASLR